MLAKVPHLQTVLSEVAKRGLPTSLDLIKVQDANLELADYFRNTRDEHFYLFHASGWAAYSRRVPKRFRTLSIFAGHGPEGTWAVRVPGVITSVVDALEWIEPAAVKEARRRGTTVLRQGDVYIVARKRGDEDIRGLPSNHSWDPATRMLSHPEHGRLEIPFKWRFYVQRTLPADGIGRVDGD